MTPSNKPDIDESIMDYIHMLGCQAMTKARNLGFAEGKGEKEDDGDLLDMIEKHEKLLAKALYRRLAAEAVEFSQIEENLGLKEGYHRTIKAEAVPLSVLKEVFGVK